MASISPHVRFPDGKCKEGMNFYKAIFGGAVEFMTVGDAPADAGLPEELDKKLIMHASLENNDFYLSGSDMMRDPIKAGDNVSIMVDCQNQKEVDDIFAKLAKGGDVFMKPEETFWGGYFGMVTDKYGVEWSLNFQMKPVK
ncbi:MAG: VOC family protein [Patescibacteria group bacterium]|nr:VOC family protein [Patescibacteria group bacterium]MDE2172373.1 VOC family protein [Patescibacteria group bacterium]